MQSICLEAVGDSLGNSPSIAAPIVRPSLAITFRTRANWNPLFPEAASPDSCGARCYDALKGVRREGLRMTSSGI